MLKIDPETKDWYMTALDEIIKTAEEQKSNGSIGSYRLGDYKKIVKKAMKVEQELPKDVEDFITGLQNRTLGVAPVNVYEISAYN